MSLPALPHRSHRHGLKSRLLILLAALLLAGCGMPSTETGKQNGRIILWHTWSGVEEEALQSHLARFNETYPGIRVISISFAPDELKREYSQKVQQGLGPDVLIGPHGWTPDLVDEDLIRPMKDEDVETFDFAASSALDTLRYRDQIFGLPLSQQTYGLYYNQKMVETPPATLDELLEQAEAGSRVGIDTSFESAFWGVQAFGGDLLDDSGRIVLNQGGFANWLEWLLEARNTPNIIPSNDQELLLDLFETGELAYYVGRSDDLLHLQETMGRDVVGVSPLPSGPTDAASPFLTTEALYFSTASSPLQIERAMLLAHFLTNTEQQRKLAQETGRIPVNPRVRIDRRITPAVAAFAEQSKSATPLLLLPQVSDVIERGQEAYIQAIEGLAIPAEAAEELTVAVNTANELDSLEAFTGVACLTSGSLTIWHGWTGEAARALNNLTKLFSEQCPSVSVTIAQYPVDGIVEEYGRALESGTEPDMVLIPSHHVSRLAEDGSIVSLEEQVDSTILQRYVPGAPDAMRHEEQLFGIPVAMNTDALYYNTDLVSEPPYDLNDLLAQVGSDRPFAMAYTPYEAAHWGMSAFGGRLFDSGDDLAIGQAGMAEWLIWLQDISDDLGMLLVSDGADALELFERGEAAYYVGNSASLSQVQERLGPERVGIVPLPAGPEGASSPLLTVDGLVLSANGDNNREVANKFVQFLISPESQWYLMQAASLVPANINVEDADRFPAISGFMTQAAAATVLANRPDVQTIKALGAKIYVDVLENGSDPAAMLDDLTAYLQRSQANPEERETIDLCGADEGDFVVWHSLEGVQEQVLAQIVVDYAQICPTVQINLVHVPAEDMPNQLAASSLEEPHEDALPLPDLVLASHDLIVPLSQERLIKPITNMVDGSTLIPYFSQAIEPLRYDGALYGLPFAMNTDVLFYNTENGEEPPTTLAELFSAATAESPFAIEADFLSSFWGVSGHEPDLQGSADAVASGEQNMAEAFSLGLGDWLKKLQVLQNRPGIVTNADGDSLRELFLVDKAAYLVANSSALPLLRAEMQNEEDGTSTLGVAMLPSGPTGPSAPLLEVDALLFGAASDDLRSQLALRFAEFATAGSSQELLVSQAAGIPANTLALSALNDPQIEEVVAQTEVSIPMPQRAERLVLEEEGNRLYQSVLAEAASPAAAVDDFLTTVAEGPSPSVVVASRDAAMTCTDEGQLSLWFSPWFEEETSVGDTAMEQLRETFAPLAEIIDNFETICPAVTVELEIVPQASLAERLREAETLDMMPNLLLSHSGMIATLAENGFIRPITEIVSDEFLDRYQPGTIRAVESENELWGVPAAMSTVALYYNSDLVEGGAATSIDELADSASPEAPVALHTDFRNAFWGISAFGAPFVNADGQVSPDQAGAQAWLAWLQANQGNPNLLLDQDGEALARQFMAGNASYLVAGPRVLAKMRDQLGEQARLVALPGGPAGPAMPLVDVGALLFTPVDEGDENSLGIIFADFATSEEMQALLLQPGSLLPVHRTVTAATSDPALEQFARMATESGIVITPELEHTLREVGDDLYGEVLDEGIDPADALTTLLDAMDMPAIVE